MKTNNPWTASRLDDLRRLMTNQNITGFIVPRVDEFQGEYVPASAERLAWISGFTGSAGTALILQDQALLFVDGRYTLQATEECSPAHFEIRHLIDQPLTDWLTENLTSEDIIGFDPWLVTTNQQFSYTKACKPSGASLKALDQNPIDLLWQDRPAPPAGVAVPYDEGLAGRTSQDKRQTLADDLKKNNQDAVILSAGDSVNWLLNIRGQDVPFTPFALAHALLYQDGTVDLFLADHKTTLDLRDHLGKDITILDPATLFERLKNLNGKTVQFDPTQTPFALVDYLKNNGAMVTPADDPCQLPKACKTDAEINGMIAAHKRDGLALVKFLHWLDETAPSGELTEMAAADRLEAFRRESDALKDLSFPTISGAGANGAIVHYRVDEQTNATLQPDSLYLVDSGGQYLDGTTDVTRTIAIGHPPKEAIRHFTLVLKGHIALSHALFPAGTTGTQLDVLARHALWQEGLDYDHGTGHGVGSYLSVHEGPGRISKAASKVALKPGMILSNEPGYYKTGDYGIRIENLVRVVEMPTPKGGDRDMMGFVPLTLAPIDRRLIDVSMMTVEEKDWLNAYHMRVFDELADSLDAATSGWLENACAPL